MPTAFLTRLSSWQASVGTDRILGLADEVERRRSIARGYSAWLTEHDRTPPPEPTWAHHSFLRYPVRVLDRAAFAATASRAGVDLGDWFVSPLHPVTVGLDRWGYHAGMAPEAEAACAEIVNLPVEPSMSERDVDRVLTLLGSTLDLIR